MKSFYIICFLALLTGTTSSQVTGLVTDEQGQPLPYVNIYLEGSSTGTTTNPDGRYQLKLPTGQHDLVFQYVGYKTISRQLDYKGTPLEINVQLEPDAYELDAVTVSASAEDPAYAIIRKAQARRRYFESRVPSYSCDVYVRGFNKLLDAPERILGMDIGDMDGLLDSTRQGVIYLSESVSKLYVLNGEQKEVMYSSKISGDDRGYSFNSAKEMTFDFYDNNIELNKRLITPIAENAMTYYQYKLEGATMDKYGHLVNKIRVIPKNEYAPCFYGYIYINEDLWNINSLELGVTGKAMQLPFMDSLTFTQSFIPLGKDIWMPFSNVIEFKVTALGFVLKGSFAAVYSSYLLEKPDEALFNNEVFVVEKEANTRSTAYWDTLRPIPLTHEERIDYVRKDSIRLVKESPEYLDSVDREHNKFGWTDPLTGYSYQNSQKRSRFSYEAPLFNIGLNTVQGWHATAGLEFSQSFDPDDIRRLSAGMTFNYGFSEEIFRPEFKLSYRANRLNNLSFTLEGGKSATQVNRRNPISPTLNTIVTLLARRNYMKLFDRDYFQLTINRDVGNPFRVILSAGYEDRRPLDNHYDGSLFYKEERSFTENIPDFQAHDVVLLRASLRIKIGEKVWKYPDRKFRVGSSWPTIWLHYRKVIDAGGGIADSDFLQASVFEEFRFQMLGKSSVFLNAGFFPGNNPAYFLDYKHFMGNRTHIGHVDHYDTRYLMLPYYDLSTNDNFLQCHFLHNFEGFIWNKLPGLKKLGWHLSLGYKYLKSSGFEYYDEWHIGLDNIGIDLFRLFRVDGVWSRNNPFGSGDSAYNFGIIVGLKAEI